MSAPFHFKQFSIVQDRAPMKVGTDGVLLGAWADLTRANHILDIGAGTGLIALMLAQRSPNAEIIALERNALACADAFQNIEASPFKNQISLVENDIQTYKPKGLFDLIISNPPFFKDSLHNPDSGRTEARHDLGFSTKDFADATKWLRPGGQLAGIYPTNVFEIFHQEMQSQGYTLQKKCTVYPTPTKALHRILFAYSTAKGKGQTLEERLVIEENGRHQYSEAYTGLTKDFYLDRQ